MADWLDAGGRGSACDPAQILDGKGWDALRDMVSAGALVSLGTTADGGALGVTVTVDGRWRKEWFRDAEELGEWAAGGLADVLGACEVARAARSASPASRSRKRL